MRQIGGAIPVAAQAVLSSRLTYVEATLTGTPADGGEIDNTAYIEFTPSAPFVFGGADDALQAPGIQLALQIWRKDDKALLWRSDVVSRVGSKHSVRAPGDLTLAAGTTYLIGWAKAGGSGYVHIGGADVAYAGLTVGGAYYGGDPTVYPATRYAAGRSTLRLFRASGQTKTALGPLDPSDFPVVTSLDALLPGQAALLDNGTDPPRLVRRRLDGSVPAFANAVSQWPVFTSRGNAFDIPGNTFTRIPLQAVQDSHDAFDAATNTYRIPETGTYRMDMKIRYADSTESGLSIGVGAGLQEIDDVPFAWGVTNPLRNGLQNYRLEQYPAGALVRLYGYLDFGSSRTIARSELIITRIR